MRFKDAGGGERLDGGVCLYVDRAVGAHREARAQLLLSIRGTNTHDDHFGRRALLLDAQRLLQRDLIEGIDAHLHTFGHDARAVRFDANADVVVHDALQANQDLAHTSAPDSCNKRRPTAERAPRCETRRR